MKILILGGYGVFGGRLAELLADCDGLELIIAGRSRQRAEAFCRRFRGVARVRPLALDRRDIAAALAAEHPALIIDASGPFQDYGAAPYGVIEAAIAAGIDYLDFADAADFVFGVDRFDAAARAAGVFVLSGVSSFPVLTSAVLRHMAHDLEVTEVEGGIAPSPFAVIGPNVMRAVAGYAGERIRLRRGGKDTFAYGLTESRRFTIAVPGRLPLRNIRFSLVDVPDLQVIPAHYPALSDIWMGAGPQPEVLHRILNLLAKARARFRLPSLEPLAGLFEAVLNRMRFGEHRGGMYVRAWGRRDGREEIRTWHLLAEGDDGPYIPSMPVEAIVRKCRAGIRPATGARSGATALELADCDALFAKRTIYTGFRREAVGLPLYRELLGTAFDALPSQVRKLHDSFKAHTWRGTAKVDRGAGLAARLVASFMRFPPAAAEIPVSVSFEPGPNGELWTRDFGGHRFSSLQFRGHGANDYLLVERFGVMEVALAVLVEGDQLRLVPRRWRVCGIPMPRALLPGGNATERDADGRFRFDVEIRVPLVGLVVGYRGTLQPD